MYCDFSTGVCPYCHLDVDAKGITRKMIIACAARPPQIGPGSELKKLLALIGIDPTTTCSCHAHALEMDRRGTAWCRQNIGTIVGWLREEAERRGLPFVEIVARGLIKSAIRRAAKNQTTHRPGVQRGEPSIWER
jgi:hypothetical protein